MSGRTLRVLYSPANMTPSFRFRVFVLPLLLIAGNAAQGRPANSHGRLVLQSDPKDIRDIFLTVPAPQNADDLFSDVIGDLTQRKRALVSPDFAKGKSVLDIPNGYLKIDVTRSGTGSAAGRHGVLVLTSFTKRNRDRLVVLQMQNLTDYPDPVATDYFYRLSAGIYNETSASDCLPPISFFAEFWGEQPEPAKAARDFVKVRGDSEFYSIEWPRNGTIARAKCVIPYSDTDSPEMDRVRKALAQHQYKSIELIWDKDKGVFVKGAKSRSL